MAVLHGKAANIIWDGADSDTELQHGQSWSVDVSHDVAEITSMQDTWKTYHTGFMDWTATVECLLDSAGDDVGLDGGDDGMGDDTCRLELYLVYSAGVYKGVYGNAICTGVSPTAEKDGVQTVTYTFQGVAQLIWHSGAAVP